MRASSGVSNKRLATLVLLGVGLGGLILNKRSTPVANKTLIVGIPANWGAIMPPLQHSVYGAAVLDNQFESLVRRGKNGLIEPLAASSWEVSPDYRVVRFKIDTKRRFSDGSNLTAADFKRSWEDGLRMAPKSMNQSVADILYDVTGFSNFAKKGTIEGIRVHGDDSLELRFDRPVRVAVEYLSGVRYAAYKLAGGRPSGTGPYVVEEKDGALLLTPNPHYAGSEPHFQEMKILVAPPETVRERLRSGAIDAAIFVEKSNLPECFDGGSGKIRCVYSQESDHVAVEVNGLPGRLFADRGHRLALQALIHEKLDSLGLPEQLKTGHFTRDPQTFLKFQPGRLSDAESAGLIQEGKSHIPALLAASQKHPIYLVSGRECQWIIDLLRDAGVKVAEKSGRIEFSRILEMSYKTHEADLIFGSFSVYNGDPDGLYHVLGRKGAIYSPAMDRPGVADLLEAGRQITDRTLLAPHYEKAARAVLREVPYVHLGFSGRGVAYNPDKTRVSESFVNRNNHRVTLFEPR